MKRLQTLVTLTVPSIVAVLLALTACANQSPAEPEQSVKAATTQMPEQYRQAHPPMADSEGWTVFSPSADSRILYVSEEFGDDQSGEVYGPTDEAVGENPRQPTDQIKPFKTFKAAFKHTRDGYPDWLLLRRGDIFHATLDVRNGRSSDEPFLLASYGDAPKMPLVKTGAGRGLKICCESFNDIALQGIDFYAHTRNFDSPEFESDDGSSGLSVYVEEGHRGTGLLVEGNKFRFFTGNAIQTDGRLTNATFRRNLVLDSYNTSGHSQGLYARNISITVEENVFDHNGWYKQQQSERLSNREGGQATMFNHNTYFQDTHDVVFRDNIFIRPASIGTKWTANNGKASTRNVELANNLFIDGEIGISMGGNKDGALRFKNIRVRDNVLVDIGRSMPTDRDFAWYLDVRDWDGGEIDGNTFIHPGSDTTSNLWAIELSGESRNVAITDNQIYGFGNGHALNILKDVELDSILVAGNEFTAHANIRNFVRAKGSVAGISFDDNLYRSQASDDRRFRINGSRMSLANWQEKTGDVESRIDQVDQIDASKVIERYHASLGKSADFDSFIKALRDQTYGRWDKDYTAQAINDWIRASVEKPTARQDMAQEAESAPEARSVSR